VAHGVQAFKKSSARKDLYDQGRLALERMVRELRDTKEVTDSSTSKITFKKAHPAQAADNIEEVKFELVGSDLKRVGDPNGTPATAVLASDVSSFQVIGTGCCSVVTVDNVSSGTTASDTASSMTVSHATSGTYRLMLVGISVNVNDDERVTDVTYGGTSLTKVGERNNDNDAMVYIYSLVAPDPGTADVVITFDSALDDGAIAGVMTFTGVDQDTPLGTFASAIGNDSTAATLNIASAEGEFVYGVAAAEYDAFTAISGLDEQWNTCTSGTSNCGAGGTTACGAATVAVSWSLDAEASPYNHWATGGVSIKPTAAVAETIAFDNVSSTTSTNNPMTLGHTIGGGTNRLLVVGISAECNEGITVTGVTYNGQALTKAASVQADTGTVGTADLWYLLEAGLPAAGTYNVQVTTSGYTAKSVGAISLAGVAQQAPEASNTNTNVGPDYISTSITTLTDGAWVVDVVEQGNAGAFTPDGGQTEQYDVQASSSTGAASTKEMATAGATSTGWSASANRLAHVVAAFAPGTVTATCSSITGEILTLQITLTDPNDSGNYVTMRTKVFLRNLP
jgi:hypothetical protein